MHSASSKPLSPRDGSSSFYLHRHSMIQPLQQRLDMDLDPHDADGSGLGSSPFKPWVQSRSTDVDSPGTVGSRNPLRRLARPDSARLDPKLAHAYRQSMQSMPPLPPLPSLPTSPPALNPSVPIAQRDADDQDADVEGEIYVEILKFEKYEIIELSDVEPVQGGQPAQVKLPEAPSSLSINMPTGTPMDDGVSAPPTPRSHAFMDTPRKSDASQSGHPKPQLAERRKQ